MTGDEPDHLPNEDQERIRQDVLSNDDDGHTDQAHVFVIIK